MNKEIEFLNSDDALFHYRSKYTTMEKIFTNKKIRLGLLKNTNDPFEYKNRILELYGKYSNVSSLSHEILKTYDELLNLSSFISFSKNIKDGQEIKQGYNKSRMWSQYGDNHSGFCLVFSKERILEQIRNELSNKYLILSNQVVYGIKSQDLDFDINDLPIQFVLNSIEKNSIEFFKKDLDYKDESEYRIVVIPKSLNFGSEIFIDISHSLKAIIIGDSFPEIYLPIVEIFSKNHQVPLYKLNWHNIKFKLEQI